MSRDALEFHAPRPQYCLDLLGANFTIGHQFSGKLIDVFPVLLDQFFRLRMQEIADGLPLAGSVGEFPQQQYATLKIIFAAVTFKVSPSNLPSAIGPANAIRTRFSQSWHGADASPSYRS